MKEHEINLFVNIHSKKLLTGASVIDANIIETKFEKNNNKYIAFSTYKSKDKYLQVILTFKIQNKEIILIGSKIIFQEEKFESNFDKDNRIMNYLKNTLDALVISVPIIGILIQNGG